MNDKVVAITGASGGIGEAAARLLAKSGARLLLGARRRDQLVAIAKEIEAEGGTAVPVELDVTNRASLQAFAQMALSQFGLFASTFHLRPPQTINFSLPCPQLFKNLQCHIQRSWIDSFQDEFRDGLIDLAAGQMLAYRLGGLDSASLANIFRDQLTMVGVISHRHA